MADCRHCGVEFTEGGASTDSASIFVGHVLNGDCQLVRGAFEKPARSTGQPASRLAERGCSGVLGVIWFGERRRSYNIQGLAGDVLCEMGDPRRLRRL